MKLPYHRAYQVRRFGLDRYSVPMTPLGGTGRANHDVIGQRQSRKWREECSDTRAECTGHSFLEGELGLNLSWDLGRVWSNLIVSPRNVDFVWNVGFWIRYISCLLNCL
jgi:hypothetical protein